MLKPLLIAGLALFPLAAAAECLNADSIGKGVVFKRDDGRSGRAVAKDGGIFIDYSTNPGTFTDERQTLFGIYELTTTEYASDEQLIGDGDTVQTWKFRGKPPQPEAGGAWRSKISAYTISYNSSEVGYQDWKGRLEVAFAFLPAKTVRISGCQYTVIPVEATFTDDDHGFTRRWLYFRDLGFGLETKRNDDGNGLTALTAG